MGLPESWEMKKFYCSGEVGHTGGAGHPAGHLGCALAAALRPCCHRREEPCSFLVTHALKPLGELQPKKEGIKVSVGIPA